MHGQQNIKRIGNKVPLYAA